MRELREDFERWWITSTIEEKLSAALILAMVFQAVALPFATLLRGSKSD